jgi:hypothetical protein
MLRARGYRLVRLRAPSERLANIVADADNRRCGGSRHERAKELQQALCLRHWRTEARGDVLTAAVAGVSNAGADVLPVRCNAVADVLSGRCNAEADRGEADCHADRDLRHELRSLLLLLLIGTKNKPCCVTTTYNHCTSL